MQDFATLLCQESLSIKAPISTSNGTLNVSPGKIVTCTKEISGNGALLISGVGTVVFSHANTVKGLHLLADSTLQIDDNNKLATNFNDIKGVLSITKPITISRPISMGGPQAIINTDKTVLISSNISDTPSTVGSLTKMGKGTIVLGGKNTYTGNTSIQQGTIEVSQSGSIDNAKITIGQQSTLFVNEGSISLASNLENFGNLQGPTAEGKRGNIDKKGFIINPKSGSHVSGNLHIFNGDVVFEPGSHLDIESNGTFITNMEIDRLVFEKGALVNLVMEPPSSPTEWLNFLKHGDQGVFLQVNHITGHLPTPEVNYPGFQATMTSSGTNFSINIEALPLASLVSNSNQKKVATVFDNDQENESLDFIYTNSELYFLQLPELQQALDQLHPALFNNVSLAQEETTSYITKILSQRLEEITWKNPDKKDRNWDIWGQGLRDYARQKGNSSLPGYTATTPGIIVGADIRMDNRFSLGFHGAYTNTHIDWERKAAHGHTSTGYGGIYGSWYTKNFLLGMSLLGGWNSSKASRSILFRAIDRNAHHRAHGWEIAPQIELGGLWEWDYISLEPFLKENYIYLHQNHYRESGAESLNLSVSSKNADLLRSELGLALFHCFSGKELQFTPEIKLSYLLESRFQGKNTSAYFLNGTTQLFTVKGLSPSRSLGHIGILLKGSSYNGFDVTLDYNLLFGKRYRDHKMALRIDVAF